MTLLTYPIACAALLAVASPSLAAALDPLAGTRWSARVLLVLAPRADDPKLLEQRSLFNHMRDGARERDLKLVEVIGDTPQAAAMRERFGLSDAGFHALLIGKDGGDKLGATDPLDADELFPTIDAMPMRQDEMRRHS